MNHSILVPMLAGDSASHDIAGLIFNGLVKYDTDLSVNGDLAFISAIGLPAVFYALTRYGRRGASLAALGFALVLATGANQGAVLFHHVTRRRTSMRRSCSSC